MIAPLSQEYFDENRQTYGAASTASDTATQHCNHELYRESREVKCRRCNAGWLDPQYKLPIV